jgi:HD-GYP domain-containing protein (c-di-GMP phosphodiesterase class II)
VSTRRVRAYDERMPAPHATTPVRFAELMAALATATEFAMSQPVEQALQSCIVAMRLGAERRLSDRELRDVYFQALLRYIGCNADTQAMSAILGDEMVVRSGIGGVESTDTAALLRLVLRGIRAAQADATRLQWLAAIGRGLLTLGDLSNEIFPGHCEVAQRLGARLGFDARFVEGLGQLYARWDGKGVPAMRGEAITPAVRIVTLAQDAVSLHRVGGWDAAAAAVRARSGTQFDPTLADLFARLGPALFDAPLGQPCWDSVLALEPAPHATLDGAALDAALQVLADFADLKSPWTLTHSSRVSAFAAAACARAGLEPSTVQLVRRAGLVHDIGRVGVSARIWGHAGPLSEGQWAQVRLHSYHTDRVLARVPALRPLALLASSAHERCDGSGYFRRSDAQTLAPAACVLAACDAYSALTEARPHRPAFSNEHAARWLADEVRDGRLDATAVRATLAAAGQAVAVRAASRKTLPQGLSEREAQVLGKLARGLTNKQIARRLAISPKTVGHHIESIYAKVDVRTRAGATLYAMEQGLVPQD